MTGKSASDFGHSLAVLWTEIQCSHVFYMETPDLKAMAPILRNHLARGDAAAALAALRPTAATAPGLAEAQNRLGEPGAAALAAEVLDRLAGLMEREAARRAPVPHRDDTGARIRAMIEATDVYDPGDHLEITADEGPNVWVNYVSRRYSPDWKPEGGDWDRDTQYMFEWDERYGLFVWLSANTTKPFQGRGYGTQFMKAAEALAVAHGFRRFSVLGPNNGAYWTKVLGYASTGCSAVTNMESYKEVSGGG